MKHYCLKKSLKESRLFESSDPDFLMFVIKYFSEDKDKWQNEWVYDGQYRKRAQCVCGKEGIETVYVVRNEITNTVLSPIGSVCIEKFSNNIMKQIQEDLASELLKILTDHTKKESKVLAMTKKFFSEKDVKNIKNAGVIDDEEEKICLKALNKRSASLNDFVQANDILIDKIVPALKKSINAAVSSSSAMSNDVCFDKPTREYFEKLYAMSKAKHYNSSDLEKDFFDLINNNLGIGKDNKSESLKPYSINDAKKLLYNEEKIIDSIHLNFYEAKIVCKADKKYLVLEDHLIKNEFGENDYSSKPLNIKKFEIKPEINYVDEILTEDVFFRI